MNERRTKEAYIVGSGPNGLTAAITMARAGFETTVIEAQQTVGGCVRSAELTLPGFVHDVCSAVYPMTLTSPAMRMFPLERFGLEWVYPEASFAHPFDDGSAAVVYRSIEATADRLGLDHHSYEQVFRPFVEKWNSLSDEILRPIRFPHHPLLLARFGAMALWPAALLAGTLFLTKRARALFAGCAAHSCIRLDRPFSAAFGLVLNTSAHAVGWPISRGGSQNLAKAMAGYFQSIGGKIVSGTPVGSLADLPGRATVLLDVTPRQLLRIAGARLPDRYRKSLENFHYGPGVFKMDWALSGPIPWRAADCAKAGTVHLGGDLEEITAAERAPWVGETSKRPFVLLVQPSISDPSRAPVGKHTAWAYCHVPNGSTEDMSGAIESQIERFAPGFKASILARSALNARQLEAHNPNLVGGDINGGAQGSTQLFIRPTLQLYRTPLDRVYICSSSTPPGGGVHGMGGYHAAQLAIRRFNEAA